jgi:GT2 family glycosyltransferase
MIPAYNCADYLRRTLQTVLAQDPGPDRMQIEVIDDCSTKDDPEAVVRELAGDRVQFFRQPSNQGVTRTFNTCLERSRGQWVQVLHGDDLVLPGIYRAFEDAIAAHPEVSLVTCPVETIDEHDARTWVREPFPRRGEVYVYREFPTVQAVTQLLQFAGVAVRREAYEQVGGFCTRFGHAADWDMWFRVSMAGPVAVVNRPYAQYRVHSGSDTNRLTRTGTNIAEYTSVISLNLARWHAARGTFPGGDPDWRTPMANWAETLAWKLGDSQAPDGRFHQMKWAWRLRPSPRRLRFLLTSWLRYRLARS